MRQKVSQKCPTEGIIKEDSMRKMTFVLLVIGLMFVFTGGFASSVMAQAAPDITSFTTTTQYVSKKALENRTARVPVSWTTVNRPILGNLVFEQVMPDGSTVNVELPRLFPWVNSNGDGIAAPIMPTASAGAITLKVTLFNLIDNTVYDTATLSLPISDTGENGPGTGYKPALTSFTSTTTSILRADLDAGTARIPVAWTSINRPLTATLVFEQVLASGEAKNVELPRETPWVNSSDKGVVAPLASGVQHNEILLRVRLIDVLFQRVYDVRTLVVNVSDGSSAKIQTFSTTLTSINENDLKDRRVYVDTAWRVDNRPANSNLVFEQIMPNGEILNVELPRDVVIVPSQGVGTMRPFPVNGQSDKVRLQLRLVDLTSRATLARSEIAVPIISKVTSPDGWIVVTGDACYSGNFPAGNRMAVSDNGRVVSNNNGAGTGLFGSPDFTGYIGELKPDETFALLEGPICRYSDGDDDDTLVVQRVWKLRLIDGREGWAQEFYKYDDQAPTILLTKTDTAPIPPVQIVAFTISPEVADYDQDVTISWDIANASRYGFTLGNGEEFSEATIQPQGSMTRKASEVIGNTNPTQLSIFAADSQSNFVTREASFSVNSAVAIKSFTVTPNDPASNGSVTLSWELEGTSQAQITWNKIYWQAKHPLTEVTTASGTYEFTLPNEYREISFDLVITDPNGVAIIETVSVQPTCPYTFFAADAGSQDDRCPDGNPRTVNAAYQTFERGFMVWTQTTETGGAAVTAFFNDGSLMQVADTWTGQTYDLGGTPPDGLIAPERGFGWAWSQNSQIRDGLGWATGTEQSYSATRQGAQAFCSKVIASNPVYQTLPDGRSVRFSPIYACGRTDWGLVN